MGKNEIYVVVNWLVFDNDTDKVDHVIWCDPETPLEDARKVFEEMASYLESRPKDRGTNAGLENLANRIRHVAPRCLRWLTHGNAGKPDEETEDINGIVHSYSGQKTFETQKLYQARLKVLAGIQPKTAALIWRADQTPNEIHRQELEREAVEAFFAEVATYWTDAMIEAWRRNNPVSVKWWSEFVKLLDKPERLLDPVNHEIVLNWLRRGYNLMTENELSNAIWTAMGQRFLPNTLKIKRRRLGLSARPPGPRPNPEQ